MVSIRFNINFSESEPLYDMYLNDDDRDSHIGLISERYDLTHFDLKLVLYSQSPPFIEFI